MAVRGATFGSMGDIASQGTGGGLVSSNTQGRTKFVGPGSMNVKIEGKNVQLLGDPMLNNCGPSGSPPNAATMTGIIQAPGMMTVIYGDDQPCGRCGKTHPLEAGNETLGMIRTLTKALRREFDTQKGRIKELNEVSTKLHEEEQLCLKLEAKKRRGRTQEGTCLVWPCVFAFVAAGLARNSLPVRAMRHLRSPEWLRRRASSAQADLSAPVLLQRKDGCVPQNRSWKGSRVTGRFNSLSVGSRRW